MITSDQLLAAGYVQVGNEWVKASEIPQIPDTRTAAAVERESDLHDEVEKHCRARGYLYFHQRMDRPAQGLVGFPDFAIWMPEKRFCVLELKSAIGKASKDQLDTIAWFRKFGFTAEIVDNFTDAIRVMETASTKQD